MSGRNRMPGHPNDLPPFGRGPPIPPMGGPPQRHHHPDDMDMPGRHMHHPHPPAMIEERVAAQLEDIHVLLVDNQRLAATHVALKQELAAAHHEIQRMSAAAGSMRAEGDARIREVHEKALKIEAELRIVDARRAELSQVRDDIQKLKAERQELTGQIQVLTQDLSVVSDDVQQAPAIKVEIETLKKEIWQARQAIEFEKKGYAENYEQGKVMEKNLISMAREVEKLRAEVANAAKRAQTSVTAGNQGASYGGNYGNADPSYGGNPYPAGYSMNPVPAADAATQYGSGAVYGSGQGTWAPYDMQQTHARR